MDNNTNYNQKWIHIFSIDNRVKQYLVKELRQLIGEQVRVTGSFWGEDFREYKDAPIVLTSGRFLYNDCKGLFVNSKIICAKRNITGKNLDKIIQLPKNKKVIVINHPKEVAEETIYSLVNMGFGHLSYIPYYREAKVDLSSIDTAISPGMMHLCPQNIHTKIDIGSRTISFSTLVEILDCLGLSMEYLDKFMYQYNRNIVETSNNLSKAYQKAEALRINFNTILNEINDSIISVDENNHIMYFNNACRKLLSLSEEKIIGNNIDKALGHIDGYYKFNSNKYDEKNGILNINDKKILVSYVPFNEKLKENYMLVFKEAEEIQKLEQNIRKILNSKGYTAKYTFKDIIGESDSLKDTIKIAKKIAKSDSTVMITGESGTGKELFAQAIHNQSLRSKAPFVAVNLSSLPENLVESELFGYSEGAFTGAKKGGKKGLFEQAHNGTIFIDEIGNISLSTQSRLLRVLQEKEIMKVGGDKIINIDVRFIAATNKDLRKLVKDGLFREDLYYRLNILPLSIPPLRYRTEDIMLLVEYFMKKQGVIKKISGEVKEVLLKYSWPGNIRELENTVEYVTQISEQISINVKDLPIDLKLHSTNKSNNDESKFTNEITHMFNEKEITFILSTLRDYKQKGTKIGRKKITILAKKSGIETITEERLRNILKHLELRNLIFIGKTKQGTYITEKGEHFLGRLGKN